MKKELDKQEIHRLLTEMLSAFAHYCDKNGLRYYLVGGTLLGAVRHKGFIPWDDDIDVGMPRPDYERFLELVEKEPIHPDYQILTMKDENYTLPFAEMVNIRTRLERETSEFIISKYQVLHLFLDIFPQDGWPEDKRQCEKLVHKTDLLRFLNTEARARFGEGTSLSRKILKTPVLCLAKMFGSKKIIRYLDKLARRLEYDECKYVGAVTYGIYGIGERCLREDVIEFDTVEFEGQKYKAPGCWDIYLKGIFGNYMDLPPEEKRINHRMRVWLEEE